MKGPRLQLLVLLLLAIAPRGEAFKFGHAFKSLVKKAAGTALAVAVSRLPVPIPVGALIPGADKLMAQADPTLAAMASGNPQAMRGAAMAGVAAKAGSQAGLPPGIRNAAVQQAAAGQGFPASGGSAAGKGSASFPVGLMKSRVANRQAATPLTHAAGPPGAGQLRERLPEHHDREAPSREFRHEERREDRREDRRDDRGDRRDDRREDREYRRDERRDDRGDRHRSRYDD